MEVWKAPEVPLLKTFGSVPIKIRSELGRLPNFGKKNGQLFPASISRLISLVQSRLCSSRHTQSSICSNIATSNLSHFGLTLYLPNLDWLAFSHCDIRHKRFSQTHSNGVSLHTPYNRADWISGWTKSPVSSSKRRKPGNCVHLIVIEGLKPLLLTFWPHFVTKSSSQKNELSKTHDLSDWQ